MNEDQIEIMIDIYHELMLSCGNLSPRETLIKYTIAYKIREEIALHDIFEGSVMHYPTTWQGFGNRYE